MARSKEPLRRFTTAALCDFIAFLNSLEDPIIVGKRYTPGLLVDAFVKYCKGRNINVDDADAVSWIAACSAGWLAKPSEEKTDDSPE